MKFYSQQGEDYFIYCHYINKVSTDGIFVELGAMDGVTYSNTKFLEDEFCFRGVLIEPTTAYDQLVVNRGARCRCYRMAVACREGVVDFVGDGAMAGISRTLPRKWTTRNGGRRYRVNCAPMSNLLKGLEFIDFMSIDVEGGELEVLQTMDWSIPVYVVVIELDGEAAEKDVQCREILAKNGLEFDIRIGGNEFWVNREYPRRTRLFDSTEPPRKTALQFLYLEPSMAAEAIQKAVTHSAI